LTSAQSVTITEDDDAGDKTGWDRELGGATDGHTVYSDADPSL